MATETVKSGWVGFLDNVAGYVRDVRVAEASKSGESTVGVRPETIADQTAMGRTDTSGPPSTGANSGRLSVGGVTFDSQVLMVTGLFVGGLVAIRLLK